MRKEVSGPENKSCRITGITWMADRKKWRARLITKKNGKSVREVVGDFSDLVTAQTALAEAKLRSNVDDEWIFLD